ncbi:MAG: AAA family ATPase [Myxococcota bacterium]
MDPVSPLPRAGPYRAVRAWPAPAGRSAWGALYGSDLAVAIDAFPEAIDRAPAVVGAARAAARLTHRGIRVVLDAGVASTDHTGLAEGVPYRVCEHLAGGPLASADPDWSWPTLRAAVCTGLDALGYAHARGHLHLRLSPATVWLAATDDPASGLKLDGFGVEPLLGSGDPQYLAPEQHLDPAADTGPWTDLYTFGALVWTWATGRPPFGHHADPAAALEAHRSERPPDFAPRFAVPPELEGWLRTLLHKVPETRFVSAADARAAFDRIEGTPSRSVGGAAPIAEPSGTGRPAADGPPPTVVAAVPVDWRGGRRATRPPRLRVAGAGGLTWRESPLVGRERQRDLLWKGLRGVHEEGRPRVVVVRGPSGVGKTRLVQWVAERAAETAGVRTLWIRGDDLRTAVIEHFGLARLEPDRLYGQIVDRLGRDRDAERLAAILAGGVAGDEETGPEPDGWRAALRRLIELEAAERPAMLVIDDAHEADEALELAREIGIPSDQVRRAVLVALIAREDDGLAERPEVENRIASVLAASRAKIVHLEPLEPGARKELYGWLGLSDSLAARVDDRSKGNPQFAIQLVDDWVTRGLLVGGPEGFAIPGGEEPPMPGDLQEVWAARVLGILHTLPGIAAIHLERAAALGMDVDSAEWDVACDDPVNGRVAEAGVRLRAQLLDHLRTARLVGDVQRGFRFAHPMLRECVEGLSRAAGRWASHHQAIATLLEAQERPDPHRVGVHWLEAGEPGRAIDPLFAGIERGMRRSGIAMVGAALGPLERALRGAGVPPDDLRWARLYVRQATVLRRRGMLIAAGELAARARGLADRPGAEEVWSECGRELSRVLHERGEVPEALGLLQQTAARLLRANAKGSELAIVLTRMAVLARMMGALDDAERWATQAHGIVARADLQDPVIEGSVIGELAVIASRRGRMDRAFELFDEALPLLRSAVATQRLAEVENNRGDSLKRAGRWDEAEAAFLEAIRLHELLGIAPEIPKLNLVLCRLHAGRHGEARGVAEEVVRGSATKINGALGVLARSVCDAADGAVGPGARDLGAALDSLQHARFVDPDAAWLAESGARLAVAAGAPQEARLFATFARFQFEALGDAEAVSRMDEL